MSSPFVPFLAFQVRWWQPVSLVGLFLIAVAGIPLLYLGLDVLGGRFDDWPLPTDFWQGVVAPYWLALVGSVLHLLVAFLKRDRAELSGSPLDGLRWIHIRWIQFLQGILGVGFVVFAALLVFDERIDWKTAILLGYSADSFVDIQLQRFEKAVSAATPTISAQLKGGGKQPEGEGK
jgi:hypothetical protein